MLHRMIVQRSSIFLCVLMVSSALSSPGHAQTPESKVEKHIKSPSPDERFAFLETYEPNYQREGTVDLIEQKSGKVLCRVVDEIDVSWSALWSPDSKHFAVTQRVSHALQGVDLYTRKGDIFEKNKLPELGADIPEKMKHGKKFNYTAEDNYTSAEKWTKDGALAVEIQTMITGDNGSISITATRDVLFGFDKAGKVKILKSSISYETEKN